MDANCNLIRNKVERKFEAATGAGDLGWLIAVLGHSILAGNDFWLSVSRNVGPRVGYRPINNWIACDEMWCRYRIYNNCKPLGEWDWVFFAMDGVKQPHRARAASPSNWRMVRVGGRSRCECFLCWCFAIDNNNIVLDWIFYGSSLAFRCWVFLDNSH